MSNVAYIITIALLVAAVWKLENGYAELRAGGVARLAALQKIKLVVPSGHEVVVSEELS